MMKGQIEEKRITWIDVARSIAILSITFNHAVNRSFAINSDQFLEFQNISTFLTATKAILYSFSRIGVPLFVMISGALLLPRNYESGTSRFVKHNWLQLLFTTELWLAIMFWYRQLSPDSILLTEGIGICLMHFVMTLLFLNPITMGSMWYMEMILCVYLLIPILSVSLKKIDCKYFLIPMAIVTFCSFILPDINGTLAALGIQKSINTKLESANVFSMHIVLLLLGYFISNNEVLKKVKTNLLILGCGLSFITFCIFQFWFYSKEYDFVVGEGYHSIFPMLVAVFLFELLRRAKIGEKIGRVATGLSRISFGIYFVHICIMSGLVAVIDHFNMGITYLWRFMFLECISFIGSVLIIKLLSHRRLTKKHRWIRWINKNLLGVK